MSNPNPFDTNSLLGLTQEELRQARIVVRSMSLQQLQVAVEGILTVMQVLLLKQEALQRVNGISSDDMHTLVEDIAHDEKFTPNLQELIAFYQGQQGVSLRRLADSQRREDGGSSTIDPARQPLLPFAEVAVGVAPREHETIREAP